MSQPGFWNDSESSSKLLKRLKQLKSSVEPWEASFKKYEDLQGLIEILGPNDQGSKADLSSDIESLSKEIEKLEFKTLLGGESDKNSAILSINAGAGGTESCDWVGMLLRMYLRFAENHGYLTQTIDILPGEEAGIKNVTVLIEGNTPTDI